MQCSVLSPVKIVGKEPSVFYIPVSGPFKTYLKHIIKGEIKKKGTQAFQSFTVWRTVKYCRRKNTFMLTVFLFTVNSVGIRQSIGLCSSQCSVHSIRYVLDISRDKHEITMKFM